MVIGAPKAGTTSLFSALCSHPDVYASYFKETHFFTDSSRYADGIHSYLDTYFDGAANYPSKGEATPSYLRSGEVVIPRLKNYGLFDNLKFIVVLRDPVERCWSHYLHRRRSLNEPLDFEAALLAEPRRVASGEDFATYFECGLYGKHLANWLSHGRRDQFFILRYEDMSRSYGKTLQEIGNFLELDSSFQFDTPVQKNQAGEPRSRILMRILSSDRSVLKNTLKHMLPGYLRRELKSRVRQSNVKAYSAENKPIMSPDVASELRRRYADDLEKLENLIGWDCASWKTEK